MTSAVDCASVAAPPDGRDPSSGGVLVIGGGLAGINLALFLHRSGVRVRVYEAYKELSDSAGYCLSLGPNGMAVLQALQLEQRLLELGVRSEAFRVVDESGDEMATVPLHAKESYGNEAVMVQRYRLHTLLANTLEAEGCHVAYSHKLVGVGQSTDGGVTATFANGVAAKGDVMVGCDGIRSLIRTQLFPAAPQSAFQGYLGLGDVLPMSALTDDERRVMRLEEGVLNMTRGRAGVFLAAAASNSTQGEPLVLVVLKTPLPLDVCERARDMDNQELLDLLLSHYGSWPSPLPRLVEQLCAPSARRPNRWLSSCFNEEMSTWHQGRAVLIGDAAHAIMPDGQGASLALEDAQYLGMLLAEAHASAPNNSPPSTGTLTAVFEQFHAHRAPRVQVINDEARRRNHMLLASPTMPAVKAWLIKRIMPWVLWFMGARMFDSEFRLNYKIPGYRIVPPRVTHSGAEVDASSATAVALSAY